MERILNPCGEFRRSSEVPVSQIHSSHLHAGASGILSDLSGLFRWGVAWVPEFSMEDLSLSITAALVPELAVKDLPLGRIL